LPRVARTLRAVCLDHANCCIGPQLLVAVDIRSGANTPFAQVAAPPEIIRRLRPGLLLTVTAARKLVLVTREHTRVIASGITAVAG
jgi:hypothetical protein